MKMENQLNNGAKIEIVRLKTLACALDTYQTRTTINILEDSDNVCHEEDLSTNIFPVFLSMIEILPKTFPAEWYITRKGDVKLILRRKLSSLTCLMFYFGLQTDTFMHLFCPYAQLNRKFGGICLTKHSTHKEIANNIIEFIKIENLKMDLHPMVKLFISKN